MYSRFTLRAGTQSTHSQPRIHKAIVPVLTSRRMTTKASHQIAHPGGCYIPFLGRPSPPGPPPGLAPPLPPPPVGPLGGKRGPRPRLESPSAACTLSANALSTSPLLPLTLSDSGLPPRKASEGFLASAAAAATVRLLSLSRSRGDTRGPDGLCCNAAAKLRLGFMPGGE